MGRSDVPTFISLFSGIDGIGLGLERAGWTCRGQVEIDPWCRSQLERHWPDVPRWGDICAVDWSAVERVDMLAGGFPCQPVSAAGKRLAQADERWLWPEFVRAIRALRPRLVFVENVAGLLSPVAVRDGKRLLGWQPAPIEEVVGDLAALGYDTGWESVRASDVGAPHRRERVFLVAHARCGSVRAVGGPRIERGETGADQGDGSQRQRLREPSGGSRPSVPDADGERLQASGGALAR